MNPERSSRCGYSHASYVFVLYVFSVLKCLSQPRRLAICVNMSYPLLFHFFKVRLRRGLDRVKQGVKKSQVNVVVIPKQRIHSSYLF